jgi:hypothetical protein
MSELRYALLNKNRVMNIIIVEQQNDDEIKTFCDAMGFDEFIFMGQNEQIPMHGLRVGKEFIPADFDYMKAIGLSDRNNAEQAAWEAQRASE